MARNGKEKLKAAEERATQPGVKFELRARRRGVNMGDLASLRRAASKGDRSALKALRAFEAGKGGMFGRRAKKFAASRGQMGWIAVPPPPGAIVPAPPADPEI